jgi:hypothetical protein
MCSREEPTEKGGTEGEYLDYFGMGISSYVSNCRIRRRGRRPGNSQLLSKTLDLSKRKLNQLRRNLVGLCVRIAVWILINHTHSGLSAEDKGKLSGLRAELKRLLKAKEEYLKEHPEHRTLVYASAHKRQKGESSSRVGDPTDRKVFGKDGLPLRPERSIYYDPVMNPYGIPPPGMLYMERRM